MTDNIRPGRFLLGMPGWPHPEWRGDYFPDDLPAEWEFAYYSNDAGCLLLPAADWLALDAAEVAGWLDDCEPWFRFYLEAPPGAIPADRLAWFGSALGGVLVDGVDYDLPEWVPVWRRANGAGLWVEQHGRASLACRDIANQNLRSLKQHLLELPQDTVAVVVDGEGVAPDRLRELRTLSELLGLT